MRRKKQIIMVVAILAIAFWVVYPNKSISSYSSKRDSFFSASEIVPSIESLPASERMIYRYKKTPWFFPIWYGQTMLLVVTYDDETFDIELNEINNQYHELPDTINIVGMGDEAKYISSCFSINSYEFRIVETGRYGCPKDFGMIAVSEEKKEIAYLYFYGFELDYITPPMSDFVKIYFNYQWV